MKYVLVVIVALAAPSFARPQYSNPQQQQQPQQYQQQQQQQSGPTSTPVSIVSQTEVVGPDGSFNFSYDTSNGIHVEQGGYVKQGGGGRSINGSEESGDVQVIQGAYSYTAPDGQQINLRYVADDQGFQPQGEHLPTPPPVPEGIARNLGQQDQQQQQPQQQYQQQQYQQSQQQYQQGNQQQHQ